MLAAAGETTVARLKRQYDDTRSKQNVERLNEDLMEISNVMQQNISDILQQGERLDHMSEMSSRLSSESKRYASNARNLSRQALVRKIAPYIALVVFLFGVFVLRKLLKCDGKLKRGAQPKRSEQMWMLMLVWPNVQVLLPLAMTSWRGVSEERLRLCARAFGIAGACQ